MTTNLQNGELKPDLSDGQAQSHRHRAVPWSIAQATGSPLPCLGNKEKHPFL